MPKRKILVVEDVKQIRHIIKFYLSSPQIEILEASDGNTALSLLRKNKFDVVLLDIRLPDMDGFSICSQIKSDPNTRNIPVIFVTARMEKEDVVKAIKSGCDDYIVKPFTKELIIRKISRFFPVVSAFEVGTKVQVLKGEYKGYCGVILKSSQDKAKVKLLSNVDGKLKNEFEVDLKLIDLSAIEG